MTAEDEFRRIAGTKTEYLPQDVLTLCRVIDVLIGEVKDAHSKLRSEVFNLRYKDDVA